MSGLHQLRQAAFLLGGAEEEQPRRDEVAEAFGWIWSALAFADAWPPPMRAEAAGLIVAMLRHGPPQYTACLMTNRELRDFLAAFRRFQADAESLPEEETERSLSEEETARPDGNQRSFAAWSVRPESLRQPGESVRHAGSRSEDRRPSRRIR